MKRPHRLHSCPACGLFGRKARRRRFDADAALVAFWAALARRRRRERQWITFLDTDDGWFFALITDDADKLAEWRDITA